MIKFLIGDQFPKNVIPVIDSAKKSIQIIVYEWRWYPENPTKSIQVFNQAIIRAKNRGVKVEVVANSEKIANILNNLGIKAKKLITKKIIHSKIMIVDEKHVIIGSHNYTQNAFSSNYEISAYIEDASNIEELLTHFKYLHNKNA